MRKQWREVGQAAMLITSGCVLTVVRQRVKEQIARDRAEKAARDKAERAAREAAASGGGVTMPQSSSPEPLARDPVASSQPKKEYDTCRLQVMW